MYCQNITYLSTSIDGTNGVPEDDNMLLWSFFKNTFTQPSFMEGPDGWTLIFQLSYPLQFEGYKFRLFLLHSR